MNKVKILVFFLIISTSLIAQKDTESYQYFIKLDSSCLFIDNSTRCYYTINLDTDTLYQIDKYLHFFDGKTIQFNSLQFNNGKPTGVKGSIMSERSELKRHKKWELKYQKKNHHKRLNNREEFYFDKNGKPFLIWWFKTPQKSKTPQKTATVYTYKDDLEYSDTASIVLEVTHQLFLDFVIHGNITISISIPVLENEILEDEIQRFKNIANSLNVFCAPIDPDFLKEKTESNQNIIFKDSLDLVEIEILGWMNISLNPFDNTLLVGFPEKENIINAAAIYWESKTDTISFQDYVINKRAGNEDRENNKTICDDEKVKRYFYTKNDSYFHTQEIYIEGENVNCVIIFTATATTYDYNIERLNEMIDAIKLK